MYLRSLKQALYEAQNKKVSSTETRQWATQAYITLMRGAYLNADRLATYPFLKRLSEYGLDTNDADDFFPDDSDFEYMTSVLNGSASFDFQVDIGIPRKMCVCFSEHTEIDKQQFMTLYEKAENAYQALVQDTPLAELWELFKNEEITLTAFLPFQLMYRVKALVHQAQKQSVPNNNFARQYSLYASASKSLLPETQAIAYLETLLGYRNLRVFFQLCGTKCHYYWDMLPTCMYG